MNFPHRYGINSVLLNEGGRHFLPSEFLLGVEPRPNGVTDQVWFTLDCNRADREQFFCAACKEPGGVEAGGRFDGARELTMMAARPRPPAVILVSFPAPSNRHPPTTPPR